MKTITRLFTLVFFAASAASAQLAPVLHYTLDEDSGSTAYNSGTAANANGTLTGTGSGWVEDSPSGKGYAYAISAPRSYISAGVLPELNAVGDFTATLWLKLSEVSFNDRIFSTRGTVAANGYLDLIAASGSSTTSLLLSLQIKGTEGEGGAANVTSAAIDVSDWTFLSIVRNGGTISFYVGGLDSDAVQLLTSVGGQSTALMGTDGSDFRIGGTAATTNDRSPEGAFSDFRFYDEALNLSQLEALRQVQVPEPGVVALSLGGAAAGLVLCLRRRRRGASHTG